MAIVTSLRIGSTWVWSSRKAGQIDGDVDCSARRNHCIAGAQFSADEELAALSTVKPCANLQWFINGNGREIANCQLARKGRFLQSADNEAGHVVECSGHDSAVGAAGCAFECAPQHNVGDHFIVIEPHLEFDACRICPTADSSVFEPAPAQD